MRWSMKLNACSSDQPTIRPRGIHSQAKPAHRRNPDRPQAGTGSPGQPAHLLCDWPLAPIRQEWIQAQADGVCATATYLFELVGRSNLRKNYILIDYENVQVKSLELLKDEQFQVMIFLGINNTKLSTEFVLSKEKLGERAEYIRLGKAGENALDFHIAYYLGQIAAKDQSGFFHIISKDKGFDPLITHLKTIDVFSARSESCLLYTS